jgi:hypothetical protein
MVLLYDDFPKAEQHRFIHQHRDGRYYVWAVYKKYVGLGTYLYGFENSIYLLRVALFELLTAFFCC